MKPNLIKLILGALISFASSMGRAQIYMPPAELFTSPFLLVDYMRWMKASQDFHSPDSLTRALAELIYMSYDSEVGRPWGAQYFPEMNRRFQVFKEKLCPQLNAKALCQDIDSIRTGTDLIRFKIAMDDLKVWVQLERLLELHIHPVQFQGPPKDLNFWIHKRAQYGFGSVTFWEEKPVTFPVKLMDEILLTDMETYRTGYSLEDFPSLITLSGGSVTVNDSRLKIQSMEFASRWKTAVESFIQDPKGPRASSVIFSNQFLFYRLFMEKRQKLQKLFDVQLNELESLTLSRPEWKTHLDRYLKAREEMKFPLEVYQHIAYESLQEIALVQGSYLWKLQNLDRIVPRFGLPEGWTLLGKQLIESLLSTQKATTESLAYLIELSTESDPLQSRAAVIDQLAPTPVAKTLVLEMLNVILELGPYQRPQSQSQVRSDQSGPADSAENPAHYFEKWGHLLMMEDLFDPGFMAERQPELWEKFKNEDGSFKKIGDFPPTERLEIFRAYLRGGKLRRAESQTSIESAKSATEAETIALFRLGNVMLALMKDKELKEISLEIRTKRGLIKDARAKDAPGRHSARPPTQTPKWLQKSETGISIRF